MGNSIHLMVSNGFGYSMCHSKSFLLFTFFMFTNYGFSQDLNINLSNGTNAIYTIQEVRKFTFNGDCLRLSLWDGSIFEWNVSILDNIQFAQFPLMLTEQLNSDQTNFRVYPNPAINKLEIEYNLMVKDEITICIYNSQGEKILNNNYGLKFEGINHEIIDLNGIPQGTYVCQLSSRLKSISKSIVIN